LFESLFSLFVVYLRTEFGNKVQYVKNKATVPVSYLIRQNSFYLCELFIYKPPKRASRSTYSMIGCCFCDDEASIFMFLKYIVFILHINLNTVLL